MGGNENRDVEKKMGMRMRCWTGNGNVMGMGMIAREWELMGTTI